MKVTFQSISKVSLNLDQNKQIAIFVDENVLHLWKEKLDLCFENANYIAVPSGDAHKTRDVKASLEDILFKRGYGRDTEIVAVGGGMTTDLIGFVASTFCRGVNVIFAPTTLLGIVDAAIGGKVGVNHPQGKNLIGAFHHPKQVVVDVDFLRTLSDEEFNSGMVEVIKYGLIMDKGFLEGINLLKDRIVSREPEALLEISKKCVHFKNSVVSEDEKESGKRRILNFGHTLGHVIEKFQNYEITHGRAVAIGILFAIRLSQLMGLLEKGSLEATRKILAPYQEGLQIPKMLSADVAWKMMALDKKSKMQKVRFVLLDAIGSCANFNGNYCQEVTHELFENAWESLR